MSESGDGKAGSGRARARLDGGRMIDIDCSGSDMAEVLLLGQIRR
jgi:hypothetical protein